MGEIWDSSGVRDYGFMMGMATYTEGSDTTGATLYYKGTITTSSNRTTSTASMYFNGGVWRWYPNSDYILDRWVKAEKRRVNREASMSGPVVLRVPKSQCYHVVLPRCQQPKVGDRRRRARVRWLEKLRGKRE